MIKGVWINDIFSDTNMKKHVLSVDRLGMTHDDKGKPLAFVAITFSVDTKPNTPHGGGMYHYYMTMDSPALPKTGDTWTQVEYHPWHAAGDEVADIVDGSGGGNGEIGEDINGAEYEIFRDSNNEEAWGEYSEDSGYRTITSIDEAYGW